MSTAIVSATIYDLNLCYKSNNNMPSLKASHFKTMVERKVLGATTTTAIGINTVRRNSGQCCASTITNSNNNNNNINNNLINNNRTTNSKNGSSNSIDLLLTNQLNSSLSTLSLSNESLSTMTLTNNLLNQQQLGGSGHRKLDRSMSEPVEKSCALQQQQQLQRNNSSSSNNSSSNSQGNSSRYKTELCRPYEENGTCKYGDKCQFAHGAHELRNLARHPKYKTELCRTFHTVGFCPYGPRCHFIHNADESRKSISGDDDDMLVTPPPPLPLQSSSSSSSSSSFSRDAPMGRPKALSVGSFSMSSSSSSTGESPPSSILSESPTTSLGSFFDDPFSVATPTTNTANNAFTFSSQDFTSALMSPGKTVVVGGGCYAANRHMSLDHFSHQQKPRRNTMDSVYNRDSRNHDVPMAVADVPVVTSPIGSVVSDLDDLRSSSPPPPTCTSPLDVSRNLRLPIFSQLSIGDD